eukprot:TRINITY_DN33248_c0_g1_i1.p1 TRINITY_DN33248_c0_g1~~TRINITY_DN33248_c0_g1_i1.p1  ORF type:complete len:790 (+),score=119.19 TRINITY_DN33248_c0_g1_i1:131-2371(+)
MSMADLYAKVQKFWSKRSPGSEKLQMFVMNFIQPCLHCEPNRSVKQGDLERLLAFLENDPKVTRGDIKAITCLATGAASRQPAYHGLMSLCAEQIEFAEKGLTHRLNRWRDPRDSALYLETATILAEKGWNHAALNHFGLLWSTLEVMRGLLETLKEHLCPDHVSPNEEQLDENDHLVSVAFGKAHQDEPHDRLLLIFDRTYTDKGLQPCRTASGPTLAGLAQRPPGFDQADSSKLPIVRGQPIAVKGLPKANEMENYVVSDPTRDHSPTFDVAAYPCTFAAARDARLFASVADAIGMEGKWETLRRTCGVIYRIKSAKFVVADKHRSHRWVEDALTGKSLPIPTSLQEHVPLLAQLRVESLPPCGLRIDAKIVRRNNKTIHMIPPPAHLSKSYTKQLRSALHNVRFGNKVCDFFGCLELGLCPIGLVCPDVMSDYQNALLHNPLNYVYLEHDNIETREVRMPWAVEGGFTFSLIGALVFAPLQHKTLSRPLRLQIAFEALATWRLGEIMAREWDKEHGHRKGFSWIDVRTSADMQEAMEEIITLLASFEGRIVRGRLTEMIGERRYGRQRSLFATGRMSVPDCWKSSALLMRSELRKWREQKVKTKFADWENKLSEGEILEAAKVGISGAVKWAHLSSGMPQQDLRAHLQSFVPEPVPEAPCDDEDDDEEMACGGPGKSSPDDELPIGEVCTQVRAAEHSRTDMMWRARSQSRHRWMMRQHPASRALQRQGCRGQRCLPLPPFRN